MGYSQGSRNTAEFDITEQVRSGKNILAVKYISFQMEVTWKIRICGGLRELFEIFP